MERVNNDDLLLSPDHLIHAMTLAERISNFEIQQADAIMRLLPRLQCKDQIHCFFILLLVGLREGNPSLTQRDLVSSLKALQNISALDDQPLSDSLTALNVDSYILQICQNVKALGQTHPKLVNMVPNAVSTGSDASIASLLTIQLFEQTPYFSFTRYWQAQIQLSRRLSQRLKNQGAFSPEKMTLHLGSLETARTETQFAQFPIHFRQWLAAYIAISQRFSVITGGPGTGKTTVCAMVMRALMIVEQCDVSDMVLCAPTGRAKSRMKDSFAKNLIGKTAKTDELKRIEAKTVHDLLKIKPDGISRHNTDNPLPYKVVAVDECSMLDVVMFDTLLSALSQDTRLILLGDKDQLCSVSPGSVLSDLTETFTNNNAGQNTDNHHRYPSLTKHTLAQLTARIFDIPKTVQNALQTEQACDRNNPLVDHLVFLTHSHRSQQVSRWWHALSTQQEGLQTTAIAHSDYVMPIKRMDKSLAAVIDQKLCLWVQDWRKEYNQFKQATDNQKLVQLRALIESRRILTVTNNGPLGRLKTNQRCREFFATGKQKEAFTEGMPIIILRNQRTREHHLYNGDLGVVTNNGMVCFDIHDQIIEIALTDLTYVEPAFAITVHKSQGSEFDHVLLLMPEKPNVLATKQLIYTGVTRVRAKNHGNKVTNNLEIVDPFGFLSKPEHFPKSEQRTGLVKVALGIC